MIETTLRQLSGFKGISIDSRTIEQGNIFVAIKGPRFNGHQFIEAAIMQGAVAIVAEESHPTSVPLFLVENTRLALAQIAGNWRKKFNIPMVALTGSCGKTTVKEMIAAIFGLSGQVLATEGNLNNEIGVPLTLCKLGAHHKMAVLELGATKKGDVAYLTQFVQPTIALITNVTAAHLTGFGSLEGIAVAKGEIYHQLNEAGVALVNQDDVFAPYWCSINHAFNHKRRVITFGLTSHAEVTAEHLEMQGGGYYAFQLKTAQGQETIQLSLPGRHHVQNALAAAAVGVACGISLSDIAVGLQQVKPVKGRLYVQKTESGAILVDDTYNANLASVRAAIAFLGSHPGVKILVLGDLAELGDRAQAIHTKLGQEAKTAGISHVYTIGAWSRLASEAFGDGAHFTELGALIERLQKHLKPGTTVLVKGSRVSAMERVVQALCCFG